jgi:hypothetical protein
MTRSLWFVHIMLIFAMIGVGGMAGNILGSGPLDRHATAQLWLAAATFGALTVAGLTTSFLLAKVGLTKFASRSAVGGPRR